MLRSPDNGKTWEGLGSFDYGRTNDWAVLNGRLYIAGQAGVGVWNDTAQNWEYPTIGLPIGNRHGPNDPPYGLLFTVVDYTLGCRHMVFTFAIRNLVVYRSRRTFCLFPPIPWIGALCRYGGERYLLFVKSEQFLLKRGTSKGANLL